MTQDTHCTTNTATAENLDVGRWLVISILLLICPFQIEQDSSEDDSFDDDDLAQCSFTIALRAHVLVCFVFLFFCCCCFFRFFLVFFFFFFFFFFFCCCCFLFRCFFVFFFGVSRYIFTFVPHFSPFHWLINKQPG